MIERRALIGFWLAALVAPAGKARAATASVRIGQGVPTVSFLPLLAARALDTFKQQELDLQFVAINGGDPPALAALDSGDIDFAAVGSDITFEAIAKGQPFELIYSLMSEVSLELVVSNDLLRRTGVGPASPLQERIAALKDATIGVSAVGGTQDRTARWLAAQGGLDPTTDLKIAMIGPPPAIHAALEHGQIDAFLLSPPEGTLTERANAGQVLIRLGAEFPELRQLPFLVLVAKRPMSSEGRALAIATARALQAATRTAIADPAAVADQIRQKFYPQLASDVLRTAIETLRPGIATLGQLSEPQIEAALRFAGSAAGKPKQGAWTDGIVEAAQQP
jgi:ABC-type nitrate/sulfonate/bicarbonate transport system substrate-binding protein